MFLLAKILFTDYSIVHVFEYLWKAAHQFFEEGSWQCERWVESKSQLILEKGWRKTAGRIRMSAAKRFPTNKNEVVEKCAKYLADRAAYSNYYDYLKKPKKKVIRLALELLKELAGIYTLVLHKLSFLKRLKFER